MIGRNYSISSHTFSRRTHNTSDNGSRKLWSDRERSSQFLFLLFDFHLSDHILYSSRRSFYPFSNLSYKLFSLCNAFTTATRSLVYFFHYASSRRFLAFSVDTILHVCILYPKRFHPTDNCLRIKMHKVLLCQYFYEGKNVPVSQNCTVGEQKHVPTNCRRPLKL